MRATGLAGGYQRPAGAPRIQGRTPREVGECAARVSGARARFVVRVLAGLAKRHPTVLGAGTAGSERAELEGLSRGLGVATSDLAAARSILESLAAPRCTNFGAGPSATYDGSPVVSWNFDASTLLKLLMGRFPFYVREVEGTIPYLCMGVPALFGIGILNAEGLSCVVNAVGVRDDGEGLSSFEMNNMAMESCSDVDGAERVFSEGPRSALMSRTLGILMNWNTIWSDRQGAVALFEYSHSHFHRQDAGPEGLIASANHHQFLDRSLTGSFDPSEDDLISGSYSRLPRMWALLREHHGRLDPAAVKRIVSDHIPDYSLLGDYGLAREWWQQKVDDSTICAHAWNFRRHLLRGQVVDAFTETAMSTTLYSLQVHPRAMTVWFTGGHPCRSETVPLYWGRVLGTEGEFPAGSADMAGRGTCYRVPERRGMFRKDATPVEASLTSAWLGLTRAVERSSSPKPAAGH